jgi:uncharacterized phage protein gp47/JayE
MTALATTTAEAYRDLLLDGLRSRIPALDTSEGSDAYVRAEALAFALEDLSNKAGWVSRQVFPDEAAASNLDRHAGNRGLTRKQAAKATGTVHFTGTTGTPILAGTIVDRVDGWSFVTTSPAVWVGGDATAPATAEEAGVNGNMDAGTALTLSSPITNVDNDCDADTDFTGGLDLESDAQLLDRLLDHLQQPPAGGTANDWKQWTLEVDGVLEAYSFPLRRGLGTVDVVIFTEGPGGARALPDAALITAVGDHLEKVRPVTVKSYQVLAATEVAVNVTVNLVELEAGVVEADVQAAVQAAVEAVFPALAPGETLYHSTDLERAVANTSGVLDFDVPTPAANTTATADETKVEVLIAGTVTVNLPS